jgi:hypothetical protein
MNPDTKIFLSDGTLIIDSFSDGLYRAVVNGMNFCSATRVGLVKAIGYFFSIYVDDCIIQEEQSVVDKMKAILSSKATLDIKQNALTVLESLIDDASASQIVAKIKSKPVSLGASYITKALGKQDFSHVTHVEISEIVPNILHKAELLRELGERVRI